MKYAVVITAGGRVGGEFARMLGTSVKALASVRGATILQRTIDAVRGAGAARVAVVGGDEVRAACASCVDRFIEESESGPENQRRALRAWEEDAALLYLTSDMPYVDARALAEFLERVPEGALALPLTEMRDFVRRFPDAPRFGTTLAGERVVNGGAFAIPAGSAAAIERLALQFFEARKSVWSMARLAGPELLVRYVFGRLGVERLERQAQRLLHLPAVAIRNAPAELAFDVDLLEEFRYAADHP